MKKRHEKEKKGQIEQFKLLVIHWLGGLALWPPDGQKEAAWKHALLHSLLVNLLIIYIFLYSKDEFLFSSQVQGQSADHWESQTPVEKSSLGYLAMYYSLL